MSGMKEFGALVKSARERKGWTGVDLANRLDRPHSFVVRIENGQNANPPDTQTFSDLARLLDLDRGLMLQTLGYLEKEPVDDSVWDAGLPAELRDILKAITWTQDNTLSAVNILRLVRDVSTARDAKERNKE